MNFFKFPRTAISFGSRGQRSRSKYVDFYLTCKTNWDVFTLPCKLHQSLTIEVIDSYHIHKLQN